MEFGEFGIHGNDVRDDSTAGGGAASKQTKKTKQNTETWR